MRRKAPGDRPVRFLADSEPPGSADESPPGQVFEEASDVLLGVFLSGQPAVEGPVSDR